MRQQSEREVTADIVRYLQQRGWVVKRVQVGLLYTPDGRPVYVGRRGQPDYQAWHPVHGEIEVEMKSTIGKPAPKQLEYIASMQHLGRRVTWANSLAMFERWYESQFAAAVGHGQGAASAT